MLSARRELATDNGRRGSANGDAMLKEETNGNQTFLKAALFLFTFIAFGITIFLLYSDKTGSAIVGAGLTLALILFQRISIVDSFEVFGLKAKLRHGVEELTRVMADINKTAEVASKLLYIQLAWMNRMGSPTWSKKRELLADIDGLLDSVGTTKLRADNLKEPFLLMIAVDFFYLFQNIARARVNHYKKLKQAEYDLSKKPGPVNQSEPLFQKHIEDQKTWSFKAVPFDDVLNDKRLTEIDEATKELIRSYPFPKEDLAILEKARTKIIGLVNICREQGTITPEASDYLEKYENPQDKLYNEIFADLK